VFHQPNSPPSDTGVRWWCNVSAACQQTVQTLTSGLTSMVWIAPVRQLWRQLAAELQKADESQLQATRCTERPIGTAQSTVQEFLQERDFKLVWTCDENASLCMGIKLTSSGTASDVMTTSPITVMIQRTFPIEISLLWKRIKRDNHITKASDMNAANKTCY
jgi:hypothetical protein